MTVQNPATTYRLTVVIDNNSMFSKSTPLWRNYSVDVRKRIEKTLPRTRDYMSDYMRSNAAFKQAVLADIEDHGGRLTGGVIEFKSQEHLTAFVLKYS